MPQLTPHLAAVFASSRFSDIGRTLKGNCESSLKGSPTQTFGHACQSAHCKMPLAVGVHALAVLRAASELQQGGVFVEAVHNFNTVKAFCTTMKRGIGSFKRALERHAGQLASSRRPVQRLLEEADLGTRATCNSNATSCPKTCIRQQPDLPRTTRYAAPWVPV